MSIHYCFCGIYKRCVIMIKIERYPLIALIKPQYNVHVSTSRTGILTCRNVVLLTLVIWNASASVHLITIIISLDSILTKRMIYISSIKINFWFYLSFNWRMRHYVVYFDKFHSINSQFIIFKVFVYSSSILFS